MSEKEKPPAKLLLHTGDQALVDAALGRGDTVTLTPELAQQIATDLRERTAEIEATYPKLVEECPYETRLAVAAWVMKAICEHAREGGTFRHLIYTRLGFGPDAYLPLYLAGGLEISNEFELDGKVTD